MTKRTDSCKRFIMKSALINFILCLAILTQFDTATAQGVEEACVRHKDLMLEAQKKQTSFSDIMKAASLNDLIFIGESHFENDLTFIYRELLQNLIEHNPDFNCVFIEQDYNDPGTGPELNRCSEDPSLLDSELLGSNSESACGKNNYTWAALQNEALRNNLKVYAVDAFDDCFNQIAKDHYPTGAEVNNCRDSKMQELIQEKFDQGICKRGLSVNGAPHITSIFEGHEPLGLRTFYKQDKSKMSVFRLNFMMSGFSTKDGVYDPRWNWTDWMEAFDSDEMPRRLCNQESQLDETSYHFGFLHEKLNFENHPYVWMKNQPQGLWTNFDATIVMSNQDQL